MDSYLLLKFVYCDIFYQLEVFDAFLLNLGIKTKSPQFVSISTFLLIP